MGTLSLAAPLVLFEKSRLWAGTGFHILPFFHDHHNPTQHNYTTQTVILPSTFSYSIQIPVPHIMWSAQAVRELKIDHIQCHLAWNPKHVIVQWVGIGTHTHFRLPTFFSVVSIAPQAKVQKIIFLPSGNFSVKSYSAKLFDLQCSINTQNFIKIVSRFLKIKIKNFFLSELPLIVRVGQKREKV